MKNSAKAGTVKIRKRETVVSWEEESELWTNGTFGLGSPHKLIDTLMYHLCLHLSLRASQEHHNLLFGENSQLCLKCDKNGEEFIQYTERSSKNCAFGINNSRLEPKFTYIYKSPNAVRCVVALNKYYVQHR